MRGYRTSAPLACALALSTHRWRLALRLHSQKAGTPHSNGPTSDRGQTGQSRLCEKLQVVHSERGVGTAIYNGMPNLTSPSATPILEGLESHTRYVVNYSYIDPYTQKIRGFSPPSVFMTDDAEPNSPRLLSALPLTPDSLEIRWSASEVNRTRKEPRYEVRCFELTPEQAQSLPRQEYQFSSDTAKSYGTNRMNFKNHQHHHKEIGGNETLPVRILYGKLPGGQYNATISDLQPNTAYLVEIVAVNRDKPGMRSTPRFVAGRTFEVPSDLVVGRVENRQIELKWRSAKVGQESFTLEYSLDGHDWQPLAENRSSTQTKSDYDHPFKISGLLPYTEYWFRLRITYRSDNGRRRRFTWPPPEDSGNGLARRFTVRTLEDRPEAPGRPRFLSSDSNLTWEPRASNSGDELAYELQARPRDANATTDWTPVYNGILNQFDARELPLDGQYDFRVRAINSIGFSDWVQTEDPLEIPIMRERAGHTSLLGIAIIVFTVILLMVGLALTTDRLLRRRSIMQKRPHGPSPPVELATLPQLPCTSNFVHQHNELYTFCDVPLTDSELASIPLIDREQIRLNQLLGSGAFGEVYEGVLYGETAQKIAVKMLRKGANEIEKAEFLKEAKLMSNFRHPHILTLLGISFDFNMSFIIMELMEDGDLLSVLRSCRNASASDPETPVGLTLEDLMGMSVDISKGCKYLEEMRFVHRDLAARNCLVASETLDSGRLKRTVKIGDFGLARDVYKSDYYRKEGEGLLPVRWMAPEALLDGVFTNCTDVWAFGVLTWEVLSLGQQPYPAMSNVDVLNYVRAGGVLACPPGCPLELYDLMCRCWAYSPEERPKFYHVLAELEKLQARVHSLTLPTAGTLGGSGLFQNGTAPPTQYNYIIPPTTAAVEHYHHQQHEPHGQQQAPYNARHRLPADTYQRLTSVPLLGLGPAHHNTRMGVDNLAYEPSSASSLISSVHFGPVASLVTSRDLTSVNLLGRQNSLETGLTYLASSRASLTPLGGSLYSLRPCSVTGWPQTHSLTRSLTPMECPSGILNEAPRTAISALKTGESADSLRGLTGSLELEGSSDAETELLGSEPTAPSAVEMDRRGPARITEDAAQAASDIFDGSSNVDSQAEDGDRHLVMIQRMMEDETERSTCSDLSAITTEDEQDNAVALRRDRPRPHSMELLESSSAGVYGAALEGGALLRPSQQRNAQTLARQRASYATALDNVDATIPLSCVSPAHRTKPPDGAGPDWPKPAKSATLGRMTNLTSIRPYYAQNPTKSTLATSGALTLTRHGCPFPQLLYGNGIRQQKPARLVFSGPTKALPTTQLSGPEASGVSAASTAGSGTATLVRWPGAAFATAVAGAPTYAVGATTACPAVHNQTYNHLYHQLKQQQQQQQQQQQPRYIRNNNTDNNNQNNNSGGGNNNNTNNSNAIRLVGHVCAGVDERAMLPSAAVTTTAAHGNGTGRPTQNMTGYRQSAAPASQTVRAAQHPELRKTAYAGIQPYTDNIHTNNGDSDNSNSTRTASWC
ncbi:proto-oncogene tyrosine-protein kinase ROS-like [Tropilaelaps mercedesae]|uniref:Tyrosine-protein kinase receptor n=1 Tax=Tropilaelaps mercedesae TaxID=418985 RepID=A0A1V9XAA5_9ACAR|nr:proto-oncogene tyrosine-protein kinase ROS-like [Tropilaelaps mercedesae]